MNAVVVVDNPRSWFLPFAQQLVEKLGRLGPARLLGSADEIPSNGNDVAFLLSCEKIVGKALLRRSRNNIVVHASALPQGKGMSPLTWQILEGKDDIPLSLFEAEEKIDAGAIYLRDTVHYRGTELLDELRESMGAKILEMCVRFASEYPAIVSRGQPQTGKATYYRRRIGEDARLDPHKTLAEQFNLLRIADNERYPAFFDWQGRRYVLRISASNIIDAT
jgi:methionyl-tRNA formyltransferase